MKRFFAIVAFLFGAISADIVQPLNCVLIAGSRPGRRRPGSSSTHGK